MTDWRRSSRLIQRSQATERKAEEPRPFQKKLTAKPPPTKKQKKSHPAPSKEQNVSKPRGRRGRGAHIEGVGEVPFDILLEIFNYLDAGDLLSLSRATKAFRAIVLDKRLTGTIWKTSFENVKPALRLGDFPKDWNLIQIADMVYGRDCSKCDTATGVTAYWPERTRLCKDCLTTSFVELDRSEQIDRDILLIAYSRYHPLNKYHSPICLRATYEAQKQELLRLKKDKAAYDEYIREGTKNRNALSNFGWIMTDWERIKWRDKIKGIDARRKSRRASYKERLIELGFQDELARLSSRALETLPGFKGTKPLSDKEWTRLEQSVIEIMVELRKDFLKRDRLKEIIKRIWGLCPIRDYYVTRHRNEVVPNIRDIANAEPFRSLIFDTEEEFQALKTYIPLPNELPRIVEEWRERATGVILGLLPQKPKPRASKKGKGKEKTPDISVLYRATSLFNCAWCSDILTYPRVLEHECLTRGHRGQGKPQNEEEYEDGDSDDEDIAGELQIIRTSTMPVWNEGDDQVEFDTEASNSVKPIITACGMDPETATIDEMDKLDARLECLRCHNPKSTQGRLVMTWRNALVHELEKHSEETSQAKWLRLSEEDKVIANAKEAYSLRRKWHDEKRVFCTECCFATIQGDQIIQPSHCDPLKSTDSQCPKGHDMSRGTYIVEVGQKLVFKRYPFPVKI